MVEVLVGKGRMSRFTLVLVALMTIFMGTKAHAAPITVTSATGPTVNTDKGIMIDAAYGAVTLTSGTVTNSDNNGPGAGITNNDDKITFGGVNITGNDGKAGLNVGRFDAAGGIEITAGTITGGTTAAGLVIDFDTSTNTTGVVISGGTITSTSGSHAISLEHDGATVTILGGSLDNKTIYSKTSLGATVTVRLGADIGSSSITGNDNKKINLVLLDDAAATTGDVHLGTGSITGAYDLSAGSISSHDIGTSGTHVGDITTTTGDISATSIYAGALTSAGKISGGSGIDATGDISVVGATDAETIVLTAETGSIKTTGDIINTGTDGDGKINAGGYNGAVGNIEAVNIGTSSKAFGDIEANGNIAVSGNIYGSAITADKVTSSGGLIAADSISVTGATSADTVVLQATSITTSGDITNNDTNGYGKIDVTGGDLSAGNIGTSTNIFGNIAVTGDIDVTGSIYGAEMSAASIDVHGAIIASGAVTAETGAITADSIDSSENDSNITARGYIFTYSGVGVLNAGAGAVLAQSADTNTDYNIDIHGALTAGDITGKAISATSIAASGAIIASGAVSAETGTLTADSLDSSENNSDVTARGDITISSGVLDAGAGAVLAQSGDTNTDYDIDVAGALTASDITGKAISATSIAASGAIIASGAVSAETGTLTADSLDSSENNSNITARGNINIQSGVLNAGAGAVLAQSDDAGTDYDIYAAGALTAGNITGKDVSAASIVASGAITASGAVASNAVISATAISAGGAVTARGAIETTSGDLDAGGNAITAYNLVDTYYDIDVAGVLTAGNITGAAISAASIVSTGVVDVTGALDVEGNVSVAGGTSAATVALTAASIDAEGDIINTGTSGYGKIATTGGNLEAANIGTSAKAVGDIDVAGDLTATGAVYAASIVSTGVVDVEGNVSVAGGTSAATVALTAASIDAEGDIINTGTTLFGKIETTGGNLEAANIGTSAEAVGDIDVAGDLTATGAVYAASIVSTGVVDVTGALDVEGNVSVAGGTSAATVALTAASIDAEGDIINTGTSGYGKIATTGGNLEAANIGTSAEAVGDIDVAGDLTATGAVYAASIVSTGVVDVTGALDVEGNVSVAGGTSAATVALTAASIDAEGDIINTGTSGYGKIATTGGNLEAANIGTSAKAVGDIDVAGDLTATGAVYAASIDVSGNITAASISSGALDTDADLIVTGDVTTTGTLGAANLVVNDDAVLDTGANTAIIDTATTIADTKTLSINSTGTTTLGAVTAAAGSGLTVDDGANVTIGGFDITAGDGSGVTVTNGTAGAAAALDLGAITSTADDLLIIASGEEGGVISGSTVSGNSADLEVGSGAVYAAYGDSALDDVTLAGTLNVYNPGSGTNALTVDSLTVGNSADSAVLRVDSGTAITIGSTTIGSGQVADKGAWSGGADMTIIADSSDSTINNIKVNLGDLSMGNGTLTLYDSYVGPDVMFVGASTLTINGSSLLTGADAGTVHALVLDDTNITFNNSSKLYYYSGLVAVVNSTGTEVTSPNIINLSGASDITETTTLDDGQTHTYSAVVYAKDEGKTLTVTNADTIAAVAGNTFLTNNTLVISAGGKFTQLDDDIGDTNFSGTGARVELTAGTLEFSNTGSNSFDTLAVGAGASSVIGNSVTVTTTTLADTAELTVNAANGQTVELGSVADNSAATSTSAITASGAGNVDADSVALGAGTLTVTNSGTGAVALGDITTTADTGALTTATGAVTADNLTLSNDTALTTGGAFTVGTATALDTNALTVAGAGDVALGAVTAGADSAVTASGSGAVSATSVALGAGTLTVTNSGTGAVALGDITTTADTGALTTASGAVTADNLTLTNDTALTAGGAFTVGTATALDTNTLMVAATGDVALGAVTAGAGSALTTSGAGAVSADSVALGAGLLTVTNGGTGTLAIGNITTSADTGALTTASGAVTATNLTLSNDTVLTAGAAFTVGTATALDTNMLTVAATGDVALGAVTAGVGSALTTSEAGAVSADSVALGAGLLTVTNGGTGTLALGDITAAAASNALTTVGTVTATSLDIDQALTLTSDGGFTTSATDLGAALTTVTDAVNLGALTVSSNSTITAGNAVTATSTIFAADDYTLTTAGTGAVNLGAITFSNTGTLAVGAETTAGAVTLTEGNAVIVDTTAGETFTAISTSLAEASLTLKDADTGKNIDLGALTLSGSTVYLDLVTDTSKFEVDVASLSTSGNDTIFDSNSTNTVVGGDITGTCKIVVASGTLDLSSTLIYNSDQISFVSSTGSLLSNSYLWDIKDAAEADVEESMTQTENKAVSGLTVGSNSTLTISGTTGSATTVVNTGAAGATTIAAGSTLNVGNDATFIQMGGNDFAVNGTGTLQLSGGTLTLNNSGVGVTNTVSNMTITGDSTLNGSGLELTANALTIGEGNTLSVESGLTLGATATDLGTGTLNVGSTNSAAPATLTLNGATAVGGFGVAADETATLTGGNVLMVNNNNGANINGHLNIGANTTLSVTNGAIVIANNTVSLANGGSIVVGDAAWIAETGATGDSHIEVDTSAAAATATIQDHSDSSSNVLGLLDVVGNNTAARNAIMVIDNNSAVGGEDGVLTIRRVNVTSAAGFASAGTLQVANSVATTSNKVIVDALYITNGAGGSNATAEVLNDAVLEVGTLNFAGGTGGSVTSAATATLTIGNVNIDAVTASENVTGSITSGAVNANGNITGTVTLTGDDTHVATLTLSDATNVTGTVVFAGATNSDAILDVNTAVSSLDNVSVAANSFGNITNGANAKYYGGTVNGTLTVASAMKVYGYDGYAYNIGSGGKLQTTGALTFDNTSATPTMTVGAGGNVTAVTINTTNGKIVLNLGSSAGTAGVETDTTKYATLDGGTITTAVSSNVLTEIYAANGISGTTYADVFDDDSSWTVNDKLRTNNQYRTYTIVDKDAGTDYFDVTVSTNTSGINSAVTGNGGTAVASTAAQYLISNQASFDSEGFTYVQNMAQLDAPQFARAAEETIGEEATTQTAQNALMGVTASTTAVSNQMTSFRSGNIASGMASSFNSGGATAALSDMADAETLAEAYEAGFTSGSDCAVYKKVQVWANGFGGFGEQGTDGSMIGYDFWNIGTMVGLDYAFAKELRVGALFGYSYNKTDVNWNSGDSTDNLLRFGAYASYNWDNFFVDLSPTMGVHILESNRNIWNGATAKGDRTGVDFNISGTVGYTFNLPADIQLTPSYSLGYTMFYDPEFTETGAGAANVKYNSFTSNSLLQDLGVRLGKLIRCSDDLAFLPEVWGGWEVEYLNTGGNRNTTTASSIGSQTYGTTMNGMATNRGYWGLGLTALIKDNVSVFGRYDQKIWDKGYNVGFTAGVKVSF